MSHTSPFKASFSLITSEKKALSGIFFRSFGIVFLIGLLLVLIIGDITKVGRIILPILWIAGSLAYIWTYFSAIIFLYKKYSTQRDTISASSSQVLSTGAMMIGVSIVRDIMVSVLSLFLLIPGLIFSIYWSFTLESLLSGESTGLNALANSKKRVTGHWWSVFLENIIHGLVSTAVLALLLAIIYLITMLLIRPLFSNLPLSSFGGALSIFMGVFVLFFYSIWVQISHFFLSLNYPLEEKK